MTGAPKGFQIRNVSMNISGAWTNNSETVWIIYTPLLTAWPQGLHPEPSRALQLFWVDIWLFDMETRISEMNWHAELALRGVTSAQTFERQHCFIFFSSFFFTKLKLVWEVERFYSANLYMHIIFSKFCTPLQLCQDFLFVSGPSKYFLTLE